MPTTAPDATYVVKDGFVGDYGKGATSFPQGDRFDASHPAVKKWPQLFRPEIARDELRVEQATAAPGEKRGK